MTNPSFDTEVVLSGELQTVQSWKQTSMNMAVPERLVRRGSSRQKECARFFSSG